jgi:hypothetical protein
VQFHARRGHRQVTGHRDGHTDRFRVLVQAGKESLPQTRAVGAERLLVDVRHEIHSRLVGHRVQVDALGQCGVGRQVLDPGDHQRLLGPGGEPGCPQSRSEVAWSVVPVYLPFELASQRGEVPYLGRDRGIRCGLVQVRP